jgi:hypothetical protein
MSAFTKYSHLPSHAEIANLEHELAVLKERRANMDRSATIGLRGGAVALVVAILLFIYGIVIDNGDATAKLFLLLFFLTLCFLLACVVDGTKLQKYFGPNPFHWPYGVYSHGIFLEKAIAAREERLAELKAQEQ